MTQDTPRTTTSAPVAIQGVAELVERLESHMGRQDVQILLADCREAARVIRALATPPTLPEGVVPVVQADRLREAAQTVLDGLNARIDAAAAKGEPVPLFAGIAELHSALAALNSPGSPK